MAFSSAQLMPMVIQGLYDHQALYNLMNRSFDGLAKGGKQTSIDIPKNPQLVVSTAAVAKDSASRKKTKDDTGMVNIPFSVYTVPISDQIEGEFATNGMLLDNFIKDSTEVLGEAFDAAVIAAAQATSKVINWATGVLQWEDITALMQEATTNKIPKRGRVIVIPGSREAQFLNLDIVKAAMAYNKDYMETGIAKVNGITFYVSNNVAKVGGKDNMVLIYGQGLAFVLKRYMERKDAYDTGTRQTDIDYNSYAACKLLRDEYAIVSKAA